MAMVLQQWFRNQDLILIWIDLKATQTNGDK